MKPLTEPQRLAYEVCKKANISTPAAIMALVGICEKSARAVARHMRVEAGEDTRNAKTAKRWAEYDRILGDRDPRLIRNVDFAKEASATKYETDRYMANRRRAANGRAVPIVQIRDVVPLGASREQFLVQCLAGRDPRDVTAGELATESGLPQHAFQRWLEAAKMRARIQDPDGLLRTKKVKPAHRWNDGLELRWWPKPAGKRRVRLVVTDSNHFDFAEVGT
jgi:hypothetical protein